MPLSKNSVSFLLFIALQHQKFLNYSIAIKKQYRINSLWLLLLQFYWLEMYDGHAADQLK